MPNASRPSYGRLELFRPSLYLGGTMPLYLDVHTISGGVATDDVTPPHLGQEAASGPTGRTAQKEGRT